MKELIRMLDKRFKEENKDLYSPEDYREARRTYINFMLGRYEPRRPYDVRR